MAVRIVDVIIPFNLSPFAATERNSTRPNQMLMTAMLFYATFVAVILVYHKLNGHKMNVKLCMKYELGEGGSVGTQSQCPCNSAIHSCGCRRQVNDEKSKATYFLIWQAMPTCTGHDRLFYTCLVHVVGLHVTFVFFACIILWNWKIPMMVWKQALIFDSFESCCKQLIGWECCLTTNCRHLRPGRSFNIPLAKHWNSQTLLIMRLSTDKTVFRLLYWMTNQDLIAT